MVSEEELNEAAKIIAENKKNNKNTKVIIAQLAEVGYTQKDIEKIIEKSNSIDLDKPRTFERSELEQPKVKAEEKTEYVKETKFEKEKVESKISEPISGLTEHKIHIDTGKVEDAMKVKDKEMPKSGKKETTALVVENESVPVKIDKNISQKKPITQLEEEKEPALEEKKENTLEEKNTNIEKKKESGIIKKVSDFFNSLLKRK